MMTRKVLNIRALLLALFISVSIGVFAQTSVKGVVLEPSGEPAIGATIMEKGTSVGTATDFDGNFSIKVASPNAVLVVSYVGMETQEVKLAGRTDLTITLKESGVSLDEVVVVGYGTMKKSDLAGASVSMSEDDLKGSIITNLDQSLQGRATGVQAMSTSGAPGSSSSIRVRGQSTINANAEPLYVIDGVIVQGGGNSGSNFGPENRWAGFHSVAAAWRFSNEKFFEPVRKVIDNGKLRLGWGQTGNANIGGYAWGVAMSRMPSALGAGYRPANIANPAIKWETQEQWNAGIDLNMLNNRLNLVVDAYIKTSKDMLMSMQLPSYMGTQGNGSSALAAPKGNFGEIQNKGIEIEVTGRPFVGEFEWESSFQISFNRNKLKALSGTENAQLVGYGQWSDVVSVSEIGQPLYNFYGYVVEGVYRDYDDIMNSPTPDHFPSDGVFNKSNTVWVGDLKYKDVNGDGKIDANDRTVIGSPMPKFTFGWTNTFRYKNIDLSIFLNGSYGNDVMNYLGINLTGMKSTWTNQLNSVGDRAQLVPIDPNKVYPAGQNWYDDITNIRVKNWQTKTPAARLNDPNDNDRISDRYIEDGSYLRIKNITLGYTFKKSLLKRLHLENLRVYCNIQNLHTFTKYKGYDPEVGASTQDSSGLVYGLDYGRYPSPTTYSFGLNISF